MKLKLYLIGLIVGLIQFVALQNSFAVSYPIQINNSFVINSVNQFDLNQTETVGALQSRMKTLLQYGEIFPTGLYVQAGTTLALNVSSLVGTHATYGKVIITDRYAGGSGGAYTQTVTLANGTNNITVTVSGNVFISYADTSPNATRKLRFTFNSGYTAMPCFIKDQTTTTEWLNMLQNYATTPDVMFIFKRGVMVLDRTKIEAYKNNDFGKIIKALDDITDVEVKGSGIITTSSQSDKNRDFGNLLYFTSNDGDRVSTTNPHATNPGLVRVPIDWIATVNHIFTGGAWGISHEIGHHQQQNSWDWGVNTEVQVNIHTLMARKLIYPTDLAMDAGTWRSAAYYLVKDNATKNYDTEALDLKAKLPVFWQLQQAFGNDDFYQRFYKYVRENSVNSGSAATEKMNFMSTANAVANKNLVNYFIQWGLNPTQTQINTLNAMGLQQPTISPLTYSEANLLENFSLLKDTVVYEGQPINYKVVAMAINGVKKVEFYDGLVKIGENTTFPFQIAFTPIFGSHPITAKLIDGLDQVLLTSSVKNVIVNRAEITSPTNMSNYMVGDNFTIVGKAVIIPGNAVQKVEFYDNALIIGESSVAPYQYQVANAARGIHKLVVKVYYQNGETSSSSDVFVNVGGLFADADSYVRDGSYTGNNYGLDGGLVVKQDGSSYRRYSFLKFKLSDLQQSNFAKATLKLNINGDKPGIANRTNWELYFVTDDTWQEEGITNSNMPPATTLLATVSSVASGAVVWDITNQLNTELTGDKIISLMLKSTVTGASYDITFASKENQNVLLHPKIELYHANELQLLPITCSQFTAKPTLNGAQLNWYSSAETDSKHYELWRGTNEKSFNLVATLKSQNVKNGGAYQYADKLNQAGTYYYKLIHTDFDGKRAEVCDVRVLNFKLLTSDIRVSPNPTKDKAIVAITAGTYTKYSVIGIQGDTLTNGIIGNADSQIEINLTSVVPGVYLIKLTGISGNTTTRVIKL